jgi:hypothetical protein
MQETKTAHYDIQITVTDGGKQWLRRTLTGLTVERAWDLKQMITALLSLARDATPGSILLETETDETTGSADISKP